MGAKIQTWQPAEIPGAAAGTAVRPADPAELGPASLPGWEELAFTPAALQPHPALQSPLAQVLQEVLHPQEHGAQPGLRPGDASLPVWSPGELQPPSPEESAAFAGELAPVESGGQAWKALKEAERRAAEIVRQAQEQASQILLRAEAQAAGQVREAEVQVTDVTRQAYADGLAAAKAETEDLLRTATTIVQEVNAWREGQFTQGEMMMLRLVIEIAQSLFGEGLPLDPETLGQAFARSLAQAKTLGDLRIYVHPEDAAALGPYWQQRQSALSGQAIELVPSDIIKRGGCFVEGQYGSVDTRVESQLQLVKDSLLSTYSSAQPLLAAAPLEPTAGDPL